MENGQACVVVAGTHKGKAGIVEDRHLSKGGNVTITVRQADGSRFKTLERSVEPRG
jgi:ribosomal protein S4E